MKALIASACVALGWWWCAHGSVPSLPTGERGPGPLPFTPGELNAVLSLSPLPPVPPDPTNRVADNPGAVRLGQWLFFDRRLSADGTIGCVSCHDPAQGWSDGRALSVGMQKLSRHSMTLWNVAYNRWFFWDGRADSLWAQALQPIEDLREHGASRLQVVHLFRQDAALRRAYEAVFGPLPDVSDPKRFPARGCPRPENEDHPDHRAWMTMTPEDRQLIDRVFANVGKALAAFQRRIVSRGSRFDAFVEGVRQDGIAQRGALTASELRGLRLFVGKARCRVCHGGPEFTDREFHDTRVPPAQGGKRRTDPGRFEGVAKVAKDPFAGTGPFSDAPDGPANDKLAYLVRRAHNKYEFKTPSLRNVTQTAPYMHQGQMATLDDVLRYYNTLEGAAWSHHSETILRPLGLTAAELSDLKAFLGTLTGAPLPARWQRRPSTPYVP